MPQRHDRGRDEEGVQFQEAPRSVPRQELGQIHEEDIDPGHRKDRQPAHPAEEGMTWLLVTQGAAHGPAGEQPGRQDEAHEDQAREPGQLTRRELDFER